MIPLNLTLTLTLSPPPSVVSLSRLLPPKLKPTTLFNHQQHHNYNNNNNNNNNYYNHLFLRGRGTGTGTGRGRLRLICRAQLSQDAPFAIAIGASILNSLLFPYTGPTSEEDEDAAAIGPTDSRFAVMTIISLIPFFNWLSWVFAFMDTGNRRYAVYAAVYLAPYIRTNLSLSPEESWLPIASILLCIIHIQLEASIRSGDLNAFTLFNDAANRFGLAAKSEDNHYRRDGNMRKVRRQDSMNLPSGKTQLRDDIRKWGIPRKPSRDLEILNEESDMEDEAEH